MADGSAHHEGVSHGGAYSVTQNVPLHRDTDVYVLFDTTCGTASRIEIVLDNDKWKFGVYSLFLFGICF